MPGHPASRSVATDRSVWVCQGGSPLTERFGTMSIGAQFEDISGVVRYALQTTRATAACPFHRDVTIRVGDDAAERLALERAKRIIKRDGTHWNWEALREEFKRQLSKAADGQCPRCVGRGN